MSGYLARIRLQLEYAGFRLLLALVRALPLDIAIRASGAGWRMVAPRLRRHARAKQHLSASMPELAPADTERIVRAMWGNLGMTMAEAMRLGEIAGEPGRVVLTPRAAEHVQQAKQSPLVFVSLHMGNWEAATVPLAAAGARIAGIYQEIQNPHVDAKIAALRRQFWRRPKWRRRWEPRRIRPT